MSYKPEYRRELYESFRYRSFFYWFFRPRNIRAWWRLGSAFKCAMWSNDFYYLKRAVYKERHAHEVRYTIHQ